MRILSNIANWLCPVGLSTIGRRYAERGDIILNQVEYIGELTVRVRDLSADNAALNEQVERLSSTMSGMQLLVREANDAVEGLTKDIEARDREISGLRASLAQRDVMMNALAADLADLARERDRIAADREAVRITLSGEAAALRQELQAAQVDAGWTTDLISAANLRSELMQVVSDPDDVPSYRALSDRQRDGKWPVVRVNGRPYIRRRDLSLVISALGLTEVRTAEIKAAA